MNLNKLALVGSVVAAAAAANAQIVLSPDSPNTFKLGGGYASYPYTPSYAGAVTSLNMSSATATTGTVNGYNFFADATGAGQYVTSVTFVLQLAGVTANSKMVNLNISALAADSSHNTYASIGPGFHLSTLTSIETSPYFNATNDTFTVTYSVAAAKQKYVEWEFNDAFVGVTVKGSSGTVTAAPEPAGIAAMAFGVAGLLIRRRRSSRSA